jgi:hypothetical protein
MVDELLDGAADGVSGAIRTAANGVQQVGETIMSALDAPVKKVTNKAGPHRIIDEGLDGAVGAGVNAITNGGFGSARIMGEGISKALDNPANQLGLSTMTLKR